MCLGIPGQVTAILSQRPPLAQVEIGGVRREVDLSCVLDQQPPEHLLGAWVVIHVGFAIAVIDPDEARRTLEWLAAMEDER